MQKLMTLMTEGRKEGAKLFFVACDLNIEMRFLCMDEDNKMKEIDGPNAWH